MAADSILRQRSSHRPARFPLISPIRVHDLSIGWQNLALALVTDEQGRVLLSLYTVSELDKVIAALKTTRDAMAQAVLNAPLDVELTAQGELALQDLEEIDWDAEPEGGWRMPAGTEVR